MKLPRLRTRRPSILSISSSASSSTSVPTFAWPSAAVSASPSASTMKLTTEPAPLEGQAKLEDVIAILEKLSADLDRICLLPHQRDTLLDKLKVYGRDPNHADPIFSKDGIEVLTRHAFNSPSRTTARSALRCIANAMLLRPKTRQLFVDQGYMGKACSMLRTGADEDEFLIARVLFLTTYDTNQDLQSLVDEHVLGEILVHRLQGHARSHAHSNSQRKTKQADPMEDMALTEVLKLLFNLTHHCPSRRATFSHSVPSILTILSKRTMVEATPLQSPIAQLINALINLDLHEKHLVHALFPKAHPEQLAERFVEYLDGATRIYTDDELEQLVSPLLALMRKVYDIGPPEVRRLMQRSLLPTSQDRETPVGHGQALSARLLRLSTNPSAPQVREAVSNLLFELSDKDAKTFVRNVGYGFASGFLFSHNLAVPESALEGTSSSGADSISTRESHESGKPFNPITGQLLATESQARIPDMTPEEKEREAEKLFVLFERLKRTGVINVQNPIQKAVVEGRFEELPEDAESDG